jgi:hypothetical protein
MRSVHVWLLTAALAVLALFQDKPWKPLEVFDADEGGYYVYLPSAFIYGDLGRADSLAIIQKAQLAPKNREMGVVRLENGKFISKYPLGVALADLPWFWGAHCYAGLTGQPQNGFSRPYQQAMMLAGLVYALLGLWIVRRLLRHYYDDGTTAWALAGIGLGTNFFAYASYNAAMAHAPLFMWQAALLYCVARWYETLRPRYALGMGLFLGLAVLTRPTEALYVLVPLCWGLSSGRAVRELLPLLLRQAGPLAAAVVAGLAAISLQSMFWHAVSGKWLLYSYGQERFIFAHPHIWDGLFSFRKGWLLYTPLAGLALLGVGPLRRYVPAAVLPILVLLPILVYVTFSWEQWWYGGGFSARPLISLYPLLALPLAALLAGASRGFRVVRGVVLLLIVLNLWQTYQYAAGIILYDGYTAELYFQNFFRPSLH